MKSKQVQTQRQEQQQRQIQSATQQQVLVSHLMELPINQLLDKINAELDDNPALEVDNSQNLMMQDNGLASPDSEDTDNDDFDAKSEREEREDAFREALEGIGRDDDELPVYGSKGNGEQHGEMVYGEEKSFHSLMMEQLGELDIDDTERLIIEYIIGSLDDDGLLRKDLMSIADELLLYSHISVTQRQLERLLLLLQTFDPAGIGARSLQECLLLQIARRPESEERRLMGEVIDSHFSDFMKKDWESIRKSMRLSESQVESLNRELCRLNPKPGASMGEIVGRNIEQITPDVIVDTNDDGTITFSLNNGDIPQLQVSPSFTDILNQYKDRLAVIDTETGKGRHGNSLQEGLLYTRQKVDKAQMFINAVNKRQVTLMKVMKAIIQWQHDFFLDGDDASLRPMALRNIADKTGINLSTVSRVCNSKYVQTRWGIFSLRHFFTSSVKIDNGDDVSQRRIKEALQELVSTEDREHPLSDEALTNALAAQGLPIARRTVAKYREQLGIPPARLRR